MKNSKHMLYVLLTIIFLAASAMFAAAIDVPMGSESLIEGRDETLNASQLSVATHGAYAGNVTEITLFGRSQTKHWQGYYGEITGIIVLDDAQNWTMYDWTIPEPKGEIYATVNATTPDWASIMCFRFEGSSDHPGSPLGMSYWERYYNMTWNDLDGINETFNMTQHPEFAVGAFTVAQDNCSSTYTHMSDSWQEDKFVEVLLTDSTGQLIFTTIIENDDEANNTDVVGFDGATHDFQLIVAEDGTSNDGGKRNLLTTTYYFYIDIE